MRKHPDDHDLKDFLPASSEGWRLARGNRLAGRLGGWCGDGTGFGHPSLFCLAVIRRPSGSGGLFELYVPLIIHLGRGRLGQAHKDLIYSPAGNEGA